MEKEVIVVLVIIVVVVLIPVFGFLYLICRQRMVTVFMNELCMMISELNIEKRAEAAEVLNKYSEDDLVYSFKPLRMDAWFTEYEIKLLTGEGKPMYAVGFREYHQNGEIYEPGEVLKHCPTGEKVVLMKIYRDAQSNSYVFRTKGNICRIEDMASNFCHTS